MRRITNRTIIAVTGMVIGAGCGAGWVRARAVDAGRMAVRDRYSPARITELAARIARRIAPDIRLDMSNTFYQSVSASARKPCREWAVECTNDLGDRVCLYWNADSGRLIRASCTLISQARGRHRLRADEAVTSGFRCLRDLHFIDKDPSWHVDGPPERNDVAWVLRFQAVRQRVTANIDRSNGRLLYAYLWW